jgi:hypothetical protein
VRRQDVDVLEKLFASKSIFAKKFSSASQRVMGLRPGKKGKGKKT